MLMGNKCIGGVHVRTQAHMHTQHARTHTCPMDFTHPTQMLACDRLRTKYRHARNRPSGLHSAHRRGHERACTYGQRFFTRTLTARDSCVCWRTKSDRRGCTPKCPQAHAKQYTTHTRTRNATAIVLCGLVLSVSELAARPPEINCSVCDGNGQRASQARALIAIGSRRGGVHASVWERCARASRRCIL